jgi:hypothetical protein
MIAKPTVAEGKRIGLGPLGEPFRTENSRFFRTAYDSKNMKLALSE